MTQRNPNPNRTTGKDIAARTTRRGFLGTLGALAGAAPLALAGEKAAPAKVAQPTAPYAPRHHPHLSRQHICDCLPCRARDHQWGNHPLVIAAGAATLKAMDALRPVAQDDGDSARDAGAIRYALQSWYIATEGHVSGGESAFRPLIERDQPATSTPHGASVLALHDALDALLDLIAGHGDEDGTDCHICRDADFAIYFVRLGIDMLDCTGLRRADFLAVLQRQLTSDHRKVERERQRLAAGATFGPNADREHYHPEKDVRHHEKMLELLRPKLAAPKNAVRRGARSNKRRLA